MHIYSHKLNLGCALHPCLHTRTYWPPQCTTPCLVYKLGTCLQHRGDEPEQAKGADVMQLFPLSCIEYIVDAAMD